ncbi:hypothetical protein AB3N60_01860 [Leptospira sp. WS39.C2]
MELDPKIGRYQMKSLFSQITMIMILTGLSFTLANCGKGDELGMENGAHTIVTVTNGKTLINGATIITSIQQ